MIFLQMSWPSCAGLGFVLLAVAALVGIAGHYLHKRAQERIAALKALAAELGVRFTPGDDHTHDEEFSQFAVFQQGSRRKASNTLRGTTPVGGFASEIVMGDYRYTTESGSGKNRRTTTWHISYLLVAVPHPDVPELLIRREGFFDRIGAFLGFDDIDFESDEFSRRFMVSSAHKRFAWDLIDPRMMAFLMDGDPPTIDIEAGWLCVVDAKRWSPEEFRGHMDFAGAFLQHWPDHVVRGLSQGQYREKD